MQSPAAQSLRAGWDDASNLFKIASSRSPWRPVIIVLPSQPVFSSSRAAGLPSPGVVGHCSGPRPPSPGPNFRPLDGSGEDESRLVHLRPAAAKTPPATVASSVSWGNGSSLLGPESATSWPGLLEGGAAWIAETGTRSSELGL